MFSVLTRDFWVCLIACGYHDGFCRPLVEVFVKKVSGEVVVNAAMFIMILGSHACWLLCDAYDMMDHKSLMKVMIHQANNSQQSFKHSDFDEKSAD